MGISGGFFILVRFRIRCVANGKRWERNTVTRDEQNPVNTIQTNRRSS